MWEYFHQWWYAFSEVQHYAQIDGWGTPQMWDILLDKVSVVFIFTGIFSVLGAVVLLGQIFQIKREGAKTVSLTWKVVFTAMFITLWPYGVESGSLALVVQAVCRLPFYAILTCQVYKDHGGFNQLQKGVAFLMVASLIYATHDATLVATVLLWVGAAVAATQPWKIVTQRDVEGVSPWVLLIYLGSATFWFFYGVIFKDNNIIAWSVAYGLVYGTGLVTYIWVRIWHPSVQIAT